MSFRPGLLKTNCAVIKHRSAMAKVQSAYCPLCIHNYIHAVATMRTSFASLSLFASFTKI